VPPSASLARPVHLIITMIMWIRTKELSLRAGEAVPQLAGGRARLGHLPQPLLVTPFSLLLSNLEEPSTPAPKTKTKFEGESRAQIEPQIPKKNWGEKRRKKECKHKTRKQGHADPDLALGGLGGDHLHRERRGAVRTPFRLQYEPSSEPLHISAK